MNKILICLAAASMALCATSTEARQLSVAETSKVTPRSILKAGTYAWRDNSDQTGSVSVRINLTTQMAYAYRGKQLIGATNVSSGREGFETPVGRFKILGKKDNHFSRKYKADMPWTMWVTGDGVALHSGVTPGRTTSHGCVHLPDAFAKQLYSVIDSGATVTITNDTSHDTLKLLL